MIELHLERKIFENLILRNSDSLSKDRLKEILDDFTYKDSHNDWNLIFHNYDDSFGYYRDSEDLKNYRFDHPRSYPEDVYPKLNIIEYVCFHAGPDTHVLIEKFIEMGIDVSGFKQENDEKYELTPLYILCFVLMKPDLIKNIAFMIQIQI